MPRSPWLYVKHSEVCANTAPRNFSRFERKRTLMKRLEDMTPAERDRYFWIACVQLIGGLLGAAWLLQAITQ